MKRLLCMMLVLALTLPACGEAAPAATETIAVQPTAAIEPAVYSEDAELTRAYALGLIPEGWSADSLTQETTCKAVCQLLSKAVELYDPSAVAEFETAVAAQLWEEGPIYDFDQLMAVYTAACAMGIGQTTNGDWNAVQEVSRDWTWDCNSHAFEKDRHKVAPFYDVAWSRRWPQWTYDIASRFWVCGQFSTVSGKPILDYEPLPEGMRRDDAPPMEDSPMTREEAVRAALRLYESTLAPVTMEMPSNPEAAAIYDAAAQRREAIVNSPSTIVQGETWEQGKTYSGTAYYVSNEGSDSNNGRSPETPWKSLEKVNRASLKPGDAVFFRRGDLWYNGSWGIWGKPGVTYSAYGEGAKPVFSGSIPGIANGENWTLHSEQNGAKIWVYKDSLEDVAGIFMNGSSQWAEKLHTGWDGENYLNADGTPFVLEEALKEDLDFVSLLDLTGQGMDVMVEDGGLKGPVYLRCDGGNPGEVFQDIQFAQSAMGFGLEGYNGSGVTVDNLCFVYQGAMGVSMSGYQGWSGTLVQNCEFGWCGGALKEYEEGDNLGYSIAGFSGAAIQMSGCDNRVIDNYFHDCDNKVLAVAIHYRGEEITTTYENLEITGNLIERSGTALHLMSCLHMYDTDRIGGFQDITFADNYVMHTGEGWLKEKLVKEDVHQNGGIRGSINGVGIEEAILENVQIRDNVFGNSAYTLVSLRTDRENFPIFSGNTYMQYECGWAARINGKMLAITENAQQTIPQELGDTSAKVIIMH